jgi:hypothetical protein
MKAAGMKKGRAMEMLSGPELLAHTCAFTVNFQTPDLLEAAVRTFREHYPEVPLLVIDNGSQDDESPTLVLRLASDDPHTQAWLLEENVYHGPAMDRAVQRLALLHPTRPFVYAFDSDTETRRGGFLEAMAAQLTGERTYATGQRVLVDKRGFALPSGASERKRRRAIPVVASYHMMLRADHYAAPPPFVHHGLPVLANFREAARRELEVLDYPVQDAVHHLGRGTAARYGYGLGWKSRLDYLLHRLGV